MTPRINQAKQFSFRDTVPSGFLVASRQRSWGLQISRLLAAERD
jgi:hypothetical protein